MFNKLVGIGPSMHVVDLDDEMLDILLSFLMKTIYYKSHPHKQGGDQGILQCLYISRSRLKKYLHTHKTTKPTQNDVVYMQISMLFCHRDKLKRGRRFGACA